MAALKAAIRQLLAAESGLDDAELPAVLITGETGTGKELVARALHFEGARSDAPFVELNCSTIPGDLLEAELFGYERGAFTDAKQRKLGLIEAAGGGTLFLDEIGDIDPRVQVKLLKLLEDKTVRRLGSVREQRANIRIVTATNRDLEQAVRDGAFRADLLFRLRIVHFELPPLRARGDDVLAARRALPRPASPPLPQAAAALHRRGRAAPCCATRWPGNVRELRNVIEQAVIMASGTAIGAAALRLTSTLAPARRAGAGERRLTCRTGRGRGDEGGLNLAEVERDLLVRALAQTQGNVTQAARLLGVIARHAALSDRKAQPQTAGVIAFPPGWSLWPGHDAVVGMCCAGAGDRTDPQSATCSPRSGRGRRPAIHACKPRARRHTHARRTHARRPPAVPSASRRAGRDR